MLSLRGRILRLSGDPLLMAIVNVSPDSFSDPGRAAPAALVERGRELADAGAALIDVGGESGRTDRRAVPEREEVARVVPVTERLAAEGLLVSVDTWLESQRRPYTSPAAPALAAPWSAATLGARSRSSEVARARRASAVAGRLAGRASTRPRCEPGRLSPSYAVRFGACFAR